MAIVTASPQANVILVNPPFTISPGTPWPNSTTMATTPFPSRTIRNVPKASAINSGARRFVVMSLALYHTRPGPFVVAHVFSVPCRPSGWHSRSTPQTSFIHAKRIGTPTTKQEASSSSKPPDTTPKSNHHASPNAPSTGHAPSCYSSTGNRASVAAVPPATADAAQSAAHPAPASTAAAQSDLSSECCTNSLYSSAPRPRQPQPH